MTLPDELPATMRAARVHTTGGPESIAIEDVPVPQPDRGELLVRVHACGVNFIDTYKRSGQYPVQLPFTLGEEGAGAVVATGEGVPAAMVDTRVAWAGVAGSYAEFVRIPASRAVEVPESVSSEVAAAAMLQGMTAHYLATFTYPLSAGDRCLVHAAAGGVGLL